MGVILTLTIVLWLASSLIEYKIVSQFEWAEKNFHGLKGMAMSVVISGTLGLITGAAAGTVGITAAVIATMIGLATNDFTHGLFSTIEKMTKFTKARTSDWKEMCTVADSHPQVMSDFRKGFIGIGKFMVAIVVAIGFAMRMVGKFFTFLSHPVASMKGVAA